MSAGLSGCLVSVGLALLFVMGTFFLSAAEWDSGTFSCSSSVSCTRYFFTCTTPLTSQSSFVTTRYDTQSPITSKLVDY